MACLRYFLTIVALNSRDVFYSNKPALSVQFFTPIYIGFLMIILEYIKEIDNG